MNHYGQALLRPIEDKGGGMGTWVKATFTFYIDTDDPKEALQRLRALYTADIGNGIRVGDLEKVHELSVSVPDLRFEVVEASEADVLSLAATLPHIAGEVHEYGVDRVTLNGNGHSNGRKAKATSR